MDHRETATGTIVLRPPPNARTGHDGTLPPISSSHLLRRFYRSLWSLSGPAAMVVTRDMVDLFHIDPIRENSEGGSDPRGRLRRTLPQASEGSLVLVFTLFRSTRHPRSRGG